VICHYKKLEIRIPWGIDELKTKKYHAIGPLQSKNSFIKGEISFLVN